MSLTLRTETSQKHEVAEILRAAANWIENAQNKRVTVSLNVNFEESNKDASNE